MNFNKILCAIGIHFDETIVDSIKEEGEFDAIEYIYICVNCGKTYKEINKGYLARKKYNEMKRVGK